MPAMVARWNATLAKYAQKYAEERKGDCKLEHSTGPYGENLMFGEGKNWTWKNTQKSGEEAISAIKSSAGVVLATAAGRRRILRPSPSLLLLLLPS
ncbi:hypothetical protein ABZP36_011301 [Zizania latifolia]